MKRSPYYFYIFKLIDITGEYFGTKYYLKLGFTRDVAKRLVEWRRDLKKMLKSNNIPENAILIDVDYYTIPGVFENGNGEYILIGRDSKNIEHFDQDVRNCLYEFELTKRQNYDIKPLEKKGIKDVFSIEGLDLYDDVSYEDVIIFFEKVFIPNIQKQSKEFQKYYFTLSEREYIQFCKEEVSKIDKDISKLNVKQFREYIEKKYDISLDMKFLTILNIDNNPYDDIESILVYMGSYLSEDTCKLLSGEYNKVNNNYQVKKTICEWICIDKDKKNEEVSLF